MSNSAIPQLNLFSSHRRHASPTRDTIDFHNYKLTRNIFQKLESSPSNLKSKITKKTQSIPIPVPVPVPIPVSYQPIIQPYISSIPPYSLNTVNRQFIHAPTTYMDYAEQYLAGKRVSILPQAQTARFINSRAIQNTRISNLNINKYGCECQISSRGEHNYLYNKNINKNIYLQENFIAPPYVNKTQIFKKKQAPQPIIPKKPSQVQIKKDPYIIETQRQKKKITKQQGQILTSIVQNYSSYSHEQKKKPQTQMQDQQTQTQEQRRRKNNGRQAQNRSSILLQKYSRVVPITLDADSFKVLITKRVQQFNQIKINFQDLPALDIEIQDLNQIRKIYTEQSSDLLARLNQLAGDRAGMTLAYKISKSNKEQKRMYWPDI